MYTVPDPVNVTVTSSPASPIWPVGSNVTLVFSVELSPKVDVPVYLSLQWSGPNWSLNNTALILATIVTVDATITPFSSNQSGNYTCTATVYSASLFHTGHGSFSRIAEIGLSTII